LVGPGTVVTTDRSRAQVFLSAAYYPVLFCSRTAHGVRPGCGWIRDRRDGPGHRTRGVALRGRCRAQAAVRSRAPDPRVPNTPTGWPATERRLTAEPEREGHADLRGRACVRAPAGDPEGPRRRTPYALTCHDSAG